MGDKSNIEWTDAAQSVQSAPSVDAITPAQRRALFAAAKEHGLDLDALRDLTPAGSISALTKQQAADLLDSLNRGTDHERQWSPRGTGIPAHGSHRPRAAKGAIRLPSQSQRDLLDDLASQVRGAFGWDHGRYLEWLGKRHFAHGRAMNDPRSSADYRQAIELLKAVLKKRRASTDAADCTDTKEPACPPS